MVDKLRLEVMLAAVDKVTGPLQKIVNGSKATADAISKAELALKKFESQQRKIQQLKDAAAQMGSERNAMRVEQSKLDTLRASPDATAKQIAKQEKAIAKQTAAYERQRDTVLRLRAQLNAMGLGNATDAQKKLTAAIADTNAKLDAQRQKLEQQKKVEERLHALREKHSRDMAKLGMRGAMAAGAMMAGQQMGGAMMPAVTAFADAEQADSQLSASMMRADGTVPAELQRITELAQRLGDKLPGTTAEFTNMMTMLRRQGMSAQSILGGLGESAAYLGVQLKMPVTAAAEFAAKMQDATQTAEGDMMGLMDTIQRAYYLGVDPSNMLQGFKNMAAVMPFLGKKGLEASQHLAPLLVMMDQAGMSGESAGNAIRKVVQLSLDKEKLEKANKLLKPNGIELKFATKEGKFAGLENMFAQIDKLKAIESDVQRIEVMKKLFGDDAETHQVLNTLMEKGQAGYAEVLSKMKDQASLQQRVNMELQTLRNVADAAQGNYTNLLSELGASIAPELKAVLTWLGEVAAKVRAWARENPQATKTMMLLAAATAVLLVLVGGLGMALVAVLAPLAIARFLMARFALGMLATTTGAAGATGAMGMLARAGAWLGASWAALRAIGVGGIFRAMGTALMSPVKMLGVLRMALGGVWKLLTAFARANPVAAIVLGLVGAFAGMYAKWDEIKTFFDQGEWAKMGAAIWEGIEWGLNAATMGMYAIIKGLVMTAWSAAQSAIGLGTEGGTTVRKAAAVAAVAAGAAAAVPAAASNPADMQASARPIVAIAAQQPATRAAGTLGSGTYQITINAAPGMDERALARAVTAELDRRERASDSRRYSRLSDID